MFFEESVCFQSYKTCRLMRILCGGVNCKACRKHRLLALCVVAVAFIDVAVSISLLTLGFWNSFSLSLLRWVVLFVGGLLAVKCGTGLSAYWMADSRFQNPEHRSPVFAQETAHAIPCSELNHRHWSPKKCSSIFFKGDFNI